MQSLKSCVQLLSTTGKLINLQSVFLDATRITVLLPRCDIHTSPAVNAKGSKPTHWLQYNKKIFPVQGPNEERRPAYVCHMKPNIKYSPKNMWYVAILVRGLSVDEAVKQLSFVLKKGAAAVKEAIIEAQEMAVSQHNVEFKSNLWVAESFVGKGLVIKGSRRHARARIGEVRHTYCHYFVRLEEGSPPANYYLPAPKNKQEMLDDWLAEMRKRKIISSL
ncbi:39S ribosomal protein L22, mitochondrial [Athalia rosae]|uniref:39S ribosomal protein L22, mitochondrial n=1 Tax=Athalia rosae TaxID=37344 RepID=UPI00203415FC|nr:39S ribosomal protein L22, mitochondrial [Athalia rosae]